MIREAVAVFDDPVKLENAVSELQSNGIDRSELSFLAHTSLADSRHGDSQRLADDPATPREPAVTDTDIRQGRVLGTSLAAAVAGLIAAGFTVATGGIAAARLGRMRRRSLMRNSSGAACFSGCAPATAMRSAARLRCCAATRRMCASMTCRIERPSNGQPVTASRPTGTSSLGKAYFD
jgi:hypothetical protein